ncbi:MAG: glycosyltransferase family protein, partial [Sphingobacterium sp.]
PLIRQEIRQAPCTNEGHYTVYLPAYDDKKILKVIGEIKNVQWQIFSKHTKQAYVKDNIAIYPVCNALFIKSMVSSQGIICGAGFETPAEALFLKKKLLVIPMKGQYEQQCNAAALKQMGVPILNKLNLGKLPEIRNWLNADSLVEAHFPDCTEEIIASLFAEYRRSKEENMDTEKMKDYSFKRLKKQLFKNFSIQNYW